MICCTDEDRHPSFQLFRAPACLGLPWLSDSWKFMWVSWVSFKILRMSEWIYFQSVNILHIGYCRDHLWVVRKNFSPVACFLFSLLLNCWWLKSPRRIWITVFQKQSLLPVYWPIATTWLLESDSRFLFDPCQLDWGFSKHYCSQFFRLSLKKKNQKTPTTYSFSPHLKMPSSFFL